MLKSGIESQITCKSIANYCTFYFIGCFVFVKHTNNSHKFNVAQVYISALSVELAISDYTLMLKVMMIISLSCYH